MDKRDTIKDLLHRGFLEDVLDIFRSDGDLYEFIGDLLLDQRGKVRVGTAVIVETLVEEEPERMKRATHKLIALLKNPIPTIRGDVAYILGLIGDKEAVSALMDATGDNDRDVREIAMESIQLINSRPF